jgi:tetratricopeptide (TPR) repeat protein
VKWGRPRRTGSTVAGGPGTDTGRPQGLDQELRKAVDQTAGYSPLCRHGEVMQALGRSLAEEGRTAEAAEVLRGAVLAFHADQDTARMAGALTDWGVSLTGLGRIEAALVAHEAALDLVRQRGDWRAEGVVLTNLGVALTSARRYQDAIDAFDLAATLLTIAGASAREAMALGGKGRALAKLGRYDEAVAALEAAAEAFRKAGDTRHEGELQAYLLITLQRAGLQADSQVRAEVAVTLPAPRSGPSGLAPRSGGRARAQDGPVPSVARRRLCETGWPGRRRERGGSLSMDSGMVLTGRFQLDELLGRGAGGEVWRARDLKLQRDALTSDGAVHWSDNPHWGTAQARWSGWHSLAD